MGSISKHKVLETEMHGKFALKEATSREEMDQIMEVIWSANYDPYEPFAQLFFPVLGCNTADRCAAIAESKSRFWEEHEAQISSHWFYVQDIETSQFVGCLQWEIEERNPFPDGPPKITTPWWPDDEHREFAERILNQTYAPRAHWMTRRHIAVNWMSVIPTYRRRGIGSLLMASYTNYADEHSYECWLEGTAMAKTMYEQFGFKSLFKIAFDTDKKNASGVWRKCEHELTPLPIYPMWRQKKVDEEALNAAEGKEGRSKVAMPWELGRDDRNSKS